MTGGPQRERLDSLLDQLTNEPVPLGLDRKNDWPPTKRLSLGKRSLRALVCYLITFRYLTTFCIGASATLAWQSYSDRALHMIANSSPVLGWLAPPAAPLEQVVSGHVTSAEPATASLQQSVDQLAAKLQQMAGDMATMQAAQQAILRKVSALPPPSPRQVAPPARNAVQN